MFGPGRWRVVHVWRGEILPRPLALQIYEDAYYQHFLRHPADLYWITDTASDVYDNAPANVRSGLDYSCQEASSNHYQDIAATPRPNRFHARRATSSRAESAS
jgi:hypothetical protein